MAELKEDGALAQLEALYRRYVGHIYTLCLRLLANVKAAEDATIEVFVRFSQELMQRWEESAIFARLRELAIDNAITRLRRRERDGQNSAERNRSSTMAKEQNGSPLDKATLDALVERLPDDLRIAFVLRDMEGLSIVAISKHLRVEEAEVRRLVHRARLELNSLRANQ